ncbi:hypothetical protein EMCRGX_G034394 [Ephydatia muelleri]
MAEDDEGDECHVHVMIEALQRELSCVKTGLAAITHQLEQNLQYSSSGPFDRCGSSVESESAKNILPAQKKLTAPTAVPKSVPKLVTSHSDRGYYIGMLDSVERERCELKKKCFMLMQKRIEHQLETLRETSRRFEQKLHVRQEKAKLERLKRKPVRYRSDGSEDWSFLRNIYQSPFYQVAELAHTHRKAGGATTMATTEAVPQVRCVDDCTEESGDDDGDINGCTDSWAITALPHEYDEQPQTDRMDSRASALRATPPSIVPVKLPQLRSIADILNEGGFGAHERKTEDVHLSKLRQLSGLRRTRHLMYQQAKCNQIAMMRLLQERSWNEFDVPIVSVPSVAPPLSVPALAHTTDHGINCEYSSICEGVQEEKHSVD